MKKIWTQQLLLVVSLVCWHSSSYSEYIYESSGNAASDGLSWVMANVLPAYTGLAVNGVVYRYTTVKDPDADMKVHVSNVNAVDGGYIFRETNDWSGIPQNTISRAVPIPYIDTSYWGDGSIEIEGEGQVVDPTVIYTYRYDDKCIVDPQSDPTCPGYRDIELPETPEYEVSSDTVLQDERDRQQTFRDEDEERRDFEKMKDKEKKKLRLKELEALLGTLVLNDMQGPSEILHNQMISLNYLSPQYDAIIPDTVYEETVVLEDSKLPDNERARRNFTQDTTHQEMLDSQYQPRSKK